MNRETKKIVGEENIIETFFRPYSEKMWGIKLEELSPDILKRIPSRDDDNEYYFPDDKYQFIPKNGYSDFIKNLLNHKNIRIKTGVALKK